MAKKSLVPALIAEFAGTAVVVLAQVGTGAQMFLLTGNAGLTIIAVAAVTALALAFGLRLAGPISGGHFNPAVTLTLALTGSIRLTYLLPYAIAQVAGGISGAIVANVLWGEYAVSAAPGITPTLQPLISEIVASVVLISIYALAVWRGTPRLTVSLVPLWVGAAMLFTPTNAVANPAFTIGRAFTDSFAGIGTNAVATFVGAQLIAAVAVAALQWATGRRGDQ